ncbi:MAG TPA: hypothetical protein VF451_00610 [Acidobacteriota bacterium]
MMRTKYIFNACICCACLVSLAALLPAAPSSGIFRTPSSGNFKTKTLTYREVEGDSTVTHVIAITPASPGYSIELSSRRERGGLVRQTFRTAADLTTLAWTFSDPSRRMELAARLEGESILLRGSVRGEKVEKKFAAAGPPWNQLFQMGLGPFALGAGGDWQFRSIGTQGPGEMKIGKFTVARRETEKIMLSGKELGAVHLRVSLSGLLAIFWHGDYWYRPLDGRFLRYRGKNRPGGPQAVSELVEEKADDMQKLE